MQHRRRTLLIAVLLTAIFVAAVFALPTKKFSVQRNVLSSGFLTSLKGEDAVSPPAINPLTGVPCKSGVPQRPFGVMLAGDTVTRPLSGIASADIVVEMPVITYGINRFLAIFACSIDGDIGSVRSARDDYIPLAASFDAIYAHWGGSHFALDVLRGGDIDHLDALYNPFAAYFRKPGIAAPHNGFTTITRLSNAAEKLGYRGTFMKENDWYVRRENVPTAPAATTVTIGYYGPYRVLWQYDPITRRYLRFRGGTPEKDKNSGVQVSAATIAVMRTTSRQIEGQYNDVRVTGTGEAIIYRLGEEISGTWEKAATPLSAPLGFLDADGNEIQFARGPLWIEVVQKDTVVEAASH